MAGSGERSVGDVRVLLCRFLFGKRVVEIKTVVWATSYVCMYFYICAFNCSNCELYICFEVNYFKLHIGCFFVV